MKDHLELKKQMTKRDVVVLTWNMAPWTEQGQQEDVVGGMSWGEARQGVLGVIGGAGGRAGERAGESGVQNNCLVLERAAPEQCLN